MILTIWVGGSPLSECNPRTEFLIDSEVGPGVFSLQSRHMIFNVQPIKCTTFLFSSSVVSNFATPWTAACQASLSFTISQSLLKLTLSHQAFQPSHPLVPFCLRSFPASGSQSIGTSASASSEYSGLISFRIAWFDLDVQGTLKSFLQHYSSKASIFQRPAFFIVQLSHWYMTTGKIIALTIQTFVGQVTSLFFNMLSRFVITSCFSQWTNNFPDLWDHTRKGLGSRCNVSWFS